MFMRKNRVVRIYQKDGLSGRRLQKRNQKEINKRLRKVRYILDCLPSAKLLESSDNPKKLPLGHLYGAINEFSQGFFDSSILSSAFAAEYAILLKLNETLSQDQRDTISRTGLGFTKAISLSRTSLIDERLAEKLKLLNNLRNMSAHPSNWVTLYHQIESMFSEEETMEKWISAITHQSPKKIADELGSSFDRAKASETVKQLGSYKDERWGKLPDLKWAAHKGTLTAQIEIVKEHSERMIKEMITDRKIFTLIEEPQNAAKYMLKRYRYPEELALEALDTAYKTLTKLRLL